MTTLGARSSGYLGGDVSMFERHKLRDRYIAPRDAVDLGWHNQCRCGGTLYAKWRRRWYCKRCARWISEGAVAEANRRNVQGTSPGETK